MYKLIGGISKKITVCIMLILIISMAINVKASSFTFTAKAQKEIVNPGDEVIIDMNISNINAGSEGINVIETSLEYDKSIFESMEFEKKNDWKVEYNDISGHSKQGKVLFVKMVSGVKQDEEIGKIKLKLKQNLGEMETEIKLKKITSNDGKESIHEGDRIIKIKIVKAQTPSDTTDTTVNKNPTKDDNTKMPKTGQLRLVYIVLGIVIIVCIIVLIYLKTKNKEKENKQDNK